MIDVHQLANQAVTMLQSSEPAVGHLALGVGSHALWDWIKSRFRRRSAGAAEAVDAIAKPSTGADDWDLLRLQLVKALKEDESLRNDMAALLAKAGSTTTTTQSNVQSGVGNANIQVSGTGNQVQR